MLSSSKLQYKASYQASHEPPHSWDCRVLLATQQSGITRPTLWNHLKTGPTSRHRFGSDLGGTDLTYLMNLGSSRDACDPASVQNSISSSRGLREYHVYNASSGIEEYEH